MCNIYKIRVIINSDISIKNNNLNNNNSNINQSNNNNYILLIKIIC